MSEAKAPVVVQTPGGLSVSYQGRLLYSSRDPSGLPLRAAAACDPGPQRLHLVASPLLWYGLPELLNRMGEGSKVLCVEADPALAELTLRSEPRALLDDPRLSFIATNSPEAIAAAAKRLGDFRACASLALSGGESLNAPLYRRMAALISAQIEAAWRNRASLMSMGRLWAKNVFSNLAYLAENPPEPFPRFELPVAVCGAGPSLETALPFLLRNRAALAVVACDTCLGTLLSAGIEPDLLVCLEAQAHNLADFTPLGSREIALVADLSSHPATFRAVRGPKFLSIVRITESPFLERARAAVQAAGLPCLCMPPLGSVGVHAAYIAREISNGPLFAFGLDFSFEAGKTHARGTPAILAAERKLDRLTRWNSQYAASFRDRVKAAPCPRLPDGRELLSDPVLLSYAALLSDLASSPGPELIDARGRGPEIGARRARADEIEAYLRQSAPAKPPQGGLSRKRGRDVAMRPAAATSLAATRSFLAGEAARLDALYDLLKGGADDGRGDLGRLVAECDYLYWSFADAGRAAKLPQDFLNRLLPEIEWWSRRIAPALESLGR